MNVHPFCRDDIARGLVIYPEVWYKIYKNGIIFLNQAQNQADTVSMESFLRSSPANGNYFFL